MIHAIMSTGVSKATIADECSAWLSKAGHSRVSLVHVLNHVIQNPGLSIHELSESLKMDLTGTFKKVGALISKGVIKMEPSGTISATGQEMT